ncbi:hypothetical protein GCM10023313_06020 [Mucilaginibacter defluvii]|uniref:DUF6443 domain-containing protein n=2 Tax=Mucilaginibacter defluvii TaxID=1196019 RepID=A0ABP9FL24_9SPHI
MLNRFIFALLIALIGFSASAQESITGPDVAIEGLSYTYNLDPSNYPAAGSPGTWIIKGGVIQQQNADAANGTIYVTVQWSYLSSNMDRDGSVAYKYSNDKGFSIHVNIIDWYNAVVDCSTIAPLSQEPEYLATPQVIATPGCAVPNGMPFTIVYQWAYATLPGIYYGEGKTEFIDLNTITWTDIPGATNYNLTPFSMNYLGTTVYRLRTKVIATGSVPLPARNTFFSYAFVKLSEFDAGSISYNTQEPYFQTVNHSFAWASVQVGLGTAPLQIGQLPSNGGLCTSKTYTWQVSYDGEPWQDIYTGVDLPSQFHPVVNINTKIRRRVECAGVALYSNTLTYDYIYNSPWTENRNYLRINSVEIPGVKSWAQADALSIGEKQQGTTYYDGLLRPIQQICKETSADGDIDVWSDVVTHIEYDGAGRSEKQYLSYPSQTNIGLFKENAKAEQIDFFHNYYNEGPTANTFRQLEFDNNPLSRAVKRREAGESWGSNTNYKAPVVDYSFNKAQENVRIWNIGAAPGDYPSTSTTYAEGSLYKITLKDEQEKLTVQYIDFSGQVIFSKVQLNDAGPNLDMDGYDGWLCTYYVYDDFGRFRFEITPSAVTALRSLNWNLAGNPTIIDELCFYADYDAKGRQIIKHSPGAGQIHSVYDSRDRLVLTQDQKQRALAKWSFCLYDEFDRPVANGLFESTENRSSHQSFVDNSTQGKVNVTLFTGISETVAAYNPIAGGGFSCNNCSNEVINKVYYYDENSFTGSATFDPGYSFDGVYSSIAETSELSFRVNGHAVGYKERVIDQLHDDNNPGNDRFLTTTIFYDEQLRNFETISQNIKGGFDISVELFDFTGKVINDFGRHAYPNHAMDGFQIFSTYYYDQVGRFLYGRRKYGSNNSWKQVKTLLYDVFGRIKTKALGQDYWTATPALETLEYSYNIHGWLTGINREYALSNVDHDQRNKYFGLALDYDNKSGEFLNSRRNGQINAAVWKTQGDNVTRRFDYGYDNIGRFASASYLQKDQPSGQWSNLTADFSVKGISYDENGNILTYQRKSQLPGQLGGTIIDDLEYHYKYRNGIMTNQLDNVIDHAIGDFKMGDFYGGSYNQQNAYEYDDNGNLIKDEYKHLSNTGSIEWNYLDKPWRIKKDGVSITEFVYDASGGKLQKIVTQLPTIANNNQTTVTTTTYLGDFIYEYTTTSPADELKFILFEEGRIRITTPVNTYGSQIPALEISGGIQFPAISKIGVFDYFVRDNQGSTRMVLTDEVHKERHACTMETANSAVQQYEEITFGNVDNSGNVNSSNEVVATRVLKTTKNWQCNSTGNYVSRLLATSTDGVVGPNMFLKVMSGDKVSANVSSYFPEDDQSTNVPLLTPLANILVGNFNNAVSGSLLKNNISSINTELVDPFGSLVNFLTTQEANANPGLPKAYLNWLFFDERFQLISGGSAQITRDCGQVTMQEQMAPKNGYAFVFISSRIPLRAVYFDDLVVNHERSAILEETHYYPGGLKMQAICAKALSKMPNQYGYQGAFAEEDEESGYTEFFLRMYDPQLNRWISPDPFDQFESPYVGMGNDPVNMIDPSGGSVPVPVRYIWNASKPLAEVVVVSSPRIAGVIRLGGTMVLTSTGVRLNNLTHLATPSSFPQPAEVTRAAAGSGSSGRGQTASAPKKKWSEKIKATKFEYSETDNIAQSGGKFVTNVVFSLWNGLVGTAEFIESPIESTENLFNAIDAGVSYIQNTEFDEILSDAGDFVSDPHNWEDAVALIAGPKVLPKIGKFGGKVLNAAADFGSAAVGAASTAAGAAGAAGAAVIRRVFGAVQRHHVIPNQIYKEFKHFMPDGYKQNGAWNLKKLPRPFHGNHPKYNDFVRRRINSMLQNGPLSDPGLRSLQKELRFEMNDILKNGTHRTLNDAYRFRL